MSRTRKAREEKASDENKVTFIASIGMMGFKDKQYPTLAMEAHLHLFAILRIARVPWFINVKL